MEKLDFWLNVLPLPLGNGSTGKEVSVLFLNCYLWKCDYRMGKSMVVSHGARPPGSFFFHNSAPKVNREKGETLGDPAAEYISLASV